MIAKSDLIILVVSSTLLGIAVFRWDQNTRNVDTSTVLANTRVVAPTAGTNSENSGSTTVSVTADQNTQQAPTSEQTVSQNDEAPVSVNEPVAVVAEEPETVETATTFLVHVVRSGDSLSEIAVEYDSSIRELQQLNNITGTQINIGQEILYPAN